MSARTPGPLRERTIARLTHEGCDDVEEHIELAEVETDRTVAYVSTPEDARLFIAAPAMLAALREANVWLSAKDTPPAVLAAVVAALALVEGRQ